MLLKFCIFLFIAVVCDEIVYAKSVRRQEAKETSVPIKPYGVTSFDYDYGIEPRRFPYNSYRQKSNPTTQRPFVSYWQNIMRNVRLPLPSITWNVTNPLANLFNMGDDQPILDAIHSEDYYGLNNQRRHKPKRRRKNTQKKRHRKNKHPIGNTIEEQENDIATQDEQALLQQYPANTMDPNGAMYFYDPNTDAYYAVQRLRALGSYMEGAYYNPADTARGSNKLEKPLIKPIGNENSDSNDAQNISMDEDDTENDINLDEAEEIDLDKMELAQPPKIEESNAQEKPENYFRNEEALRSVLGSYMLDDHFNRQRQRNKDQRKKHNASKQIPRDNLRYYFLLNRN